MQFKINNDIKKIKQISNKILECLSSKQLSEDFKFDVRLACEEAIINAIKYGNKSNPNKSVNIDCHISQEAVAISIKDEGEGFDYKNLPDPTEDQNLFKNGGRGLFLIHKIMDKVEFNSKGNRITMTKFLPKTERGKTCK